MKPPLIPRYRNFQERRRAWLTGTFLKDFGRSDMELYEPTKEQIKLDTARSFTQFAGLTLSPLTPKLHLEIDDVTRGELRRQLEVVLCRFFCLYPDYHYFQGFHDVCSVLLLTLRDMDDTVRVIVKLSQTHFRNLMQHNFDIVRSLVGLMLGILRVSDPPLHRQITRLSIPPFFAISWLITWFAHDLPNHHNAQRMFDFFMANHPSAIVYAAAAVPMLHREELLMVDVEGPEVHQWLKKLPERIAPSLLILHTVKLMKDYPLDRINFSDSKLIRKTVYGAGIRKNSHIASLIVGSSLLVLLVSLVLSRYSFNNT